MNRREAFNNHYHHNMFQGKESKSGPGSDPDQTAKIKIEIPKLCKELKIKRLLDAPCGDCNWMKDIWDELNLDMYIGMDIVDDLITLNKEKYYLPNRGFLRCDLVEAKSLPTVDLMICRDCLVHLSFESAIQVLRHMANSDIPYFLLTTFSNLARNNYDWEDGTNWYPMNLTNHPFNLPKPKILINEGCTEGGTEYKDKCLGLWSREELKQIYG